MKRRASLLLVLMVGTVMVLGSCEDGDTGPVGATGVEKAPVEEEPIQERKKWVTMADPGGSVAMLSSPYSRTQEDFDCSPRVPHGVKLQVLEIVTVRMRRWENGAIREVQYPLYKVEYKGESGWVGQDFVTINYTK